VRDKETTIQLHTHKIPHEAYSLEISYSLHLLILVISYIHIESSFSVLKNLFNFLYFCLLELKLEVTKLWKSQATNII